MDLANAVAHRLVREKIYLVLFGFPMSINVDGLQPISKGIQVDLTGIKHPIFYVCSIICTYSDGLDNKSKQKASKGIEEYFAPHLLLLSKYCMIQVYFVRSKL